MIIECATDNRNRTVADIRSILTKHGGRLAESGAVSYLFSPPTGLITVPKDATDEDTLIAVALEAGADDVKLGDDVFNVTTEPGNLGTVQAALQKASIAILSAEVTRIPATTVRVEGKEAQQVLRLMDLLEDLDDVQTVHANFDIPDEVLETAAG